MWNRGGVRSSALERAKAQLSGQRGTSRDGQRNVVVGVSQPHNSSSAAVDGLMHTSVL